MPDAPGRTQYAFFEGLFERALKPSGAFLVDLRAAGYDPASPLPSYPSKVWADAIAVAAKYIGCSPDPQLAHRRVGYAFVAGFLDTILGSFIKATVPFLTLRLVFKRWPQYTSGGRDDMTVTSSVDAAGRFVLTCTDPTGVPAGFMAGCVDYAMELLQKRGANGGAVSFVERGPGDYDVIVTPGAAAA